MTVRQALRYERVSRAIYHTAGVISVFLAGWNWIEGELMGVLVSVAWVGLQLYFLKQSKARTARIMELVEEAKRRGQ